MTIPRAILGLCALLALVDGALWEAAGIAAVVVVLVVFWPHGFGQRPVGVRVWWRSGGWGGGWRL